MAVVEEIEAPFEKRDNGKFSTLLRNSTNESISWNLALVTNPGSVLENSLDLDFCEGVIALRSGKVIKEWTVINKNYSAPLVCLARLPMFSKLLPEKFINEGLPLTPAYNFDSTNAS